MKISSTATAALALIVPCLSQAVTFPENSDSTRWLGDVTVTAIKQQSDLSLTPGAVTSINSTQAARWGVYALRGMSEVAPNFYIPTYGSRMTSAIYVRGIGARMDHPAVGLNVDNVPVMDKDAYDFDILDIDRIEVLRGAQSTLYGRNTMAGQINISTLQPMDYQGNRVFAEIANGPQARLGLSKYIKFKPSLAMAFSGFFRFSEGFYRNHYNARKVDGEKGLNLRWKTQWQASGSVSVDNVASFSLSRQNGYPYEYDGSGQINYNDTCFYRRNALMDGLTVKWRGPGFTLSSITSVQYLDDNVTLDQDFLPLSYFTLSQRRHEWALTEDLVARGDVGSWSWVAGLFGFYKHNSMKAPVTLKSDGIERLITNRVNLNDRIPVRLEWGSPDMLLESHFKIPTWGVALYHQSAYDFGRWNAALGLRLDYEHTGLDYRSICNTSYSVFMKSGVPPVPIMTNTIDIDDHGNLSDHFLEFVPKFTLSYSLPMRSASTVYASVGKGYKSGGYNTQMFSEILQQKMMSVMMSQMPGMSQGSAGTEPDVDNIISYRPERSWNYELGAHIACAEGRVMTDLALFYIDCRDQQLTMFPDESTTGRITTNAGRTRSFGAEVQIRFNPDTHWSVNASYGYTNAKFRRFIDGPEDYSGKYVPYAPVNTLFLSATYRHAVADGFNLSYNANCRAVGRIYWNEANTQRQPMYALLGFSVQADWKWLSVEAWMKNVTGTRYDTFWFQSLGSSFLQRGFPRRYGITLRMHFDS